MHPLRALYKTKKQHLASLRSLDTKMERIRHSLNQMYCPSDENNRNCHFPTLLRDLGNRSCRAAKCDLSGVCGVTTEPDDVSREAFARDKDESRAAGLSIDRLGDFFWNGLTFRPFFPHPPSDGVELINRKMAIHFCGGIFVRRTPIDILVFVEEAIVVFDHVFQDFSRTPFIHVADSNRPPLASMAIGFSLSRFAGKIQLGGTGFALAKIA